MEKKWKKSIMTSKLCIHYVYIDELIERERALDRETHSNVLNSTTKEIFISECELIEYNRHTQAHAHSTHVLVQCTHCDTLLCIVFYVIHFVICCVVWHSRNCVWPYMGLSIQRNISYVKPLHWIFMFHSITCDRVRIISNFKYLHMKATFVSVNERTNVKNE